MWAEYTTSHSKHIYNIGFSFLKTICNIQLYRHTYICRGMHMLLVLLSLLVGTHCWPPLVRVCDPYIRFCPWLGMESVHEGGITRCTMSVPILALQSTLILWYNHTYHNNGHYISYMWYSHSWSCFLVMFCPIMHYHILSRPSFRSCMALYKYT